MRAILDCEASYAVRGGVGSAYTIRHSTLPFREGQRLEVPDLQPDALHRPRLPAARRGAFWKVESWFLRESLDAQSP